MQHIFFIRHGTTQDLEAAKVQGATDSPLSRKGRIEAQKTAQALAGIHFDAVFCSPQGRARETANIICAEKSIQPIILNDLREMNFGWLEGGSFFEAPSPHTHFRERLQLYIKIILAQVSGEYSRHVYKRARKSWRIIQQYVPNGRILIVAHGVIGNYFFKAILPKEHFDHLQPILLNTCSISELILNENGSKQIVRINDTQHLL